MHTHFRTVGSLDAIRSQLADCLRGITVGKVRDEESLNELAEAAQLLEALPLGTGDFVVACNRLNNARRYLDWGERGAAHYEVQLLIRSMAQT